MIDLSGVEIVLRAALPDLLKPGATFPQAVENGAYRIISFDDRRVVVQSEESSKRKYSLSYEKIAVVLLHFPAIRPLSIHAGVAKAMKAHALTETMTETVLYALVRFLLKEARLRSALGAS